MLHMPPKSRLKLPPLDLGKESFGERLKRLRTERGVTQVELANKIGIIQVMISDYENDRTRMHAEMVVRFARALSVSTDVLLGFKETPPAENKLRRRVLHRLAKIEELPIRSQKTLLKTIDTFLKGASA